MRGFWLILKFGHHDQEENITIIWTWFIWLSSLSPTFLNSIIFLNFLISILPKFASSLLPLPFLIIHPRRNIKKKPLRLIKYFGLNVQSIGLKLFFLLHVLDKLENRLWIPSLGAETFEPAHVCSFLCEAKLNVAIPSNIFHWHWTNRDHGIVFSCEQQSTEWKSFDFFWLNFEQI